MSYKKPNSGNSLFLIEMLFSLLILALACAACIRIFAASEINRQTARELNHIQELVISVGEMTEGWDGEISSVEALFPGGSFSGTTGTYYYNKDWELCDSQDSFYRMELSLNASHQKKTADICIFSNPEKILYQTTFSFPFLLNEKEVDS